MSRPTIHTRSPATVVLLTLVTFGLYGLWWLHRTTKELKDTTGRRDLDPTLDVVLTLVTLGLWGLWVGVRNAGILHEALESRGAESKDRTLTVALFAAATYWTLYAALIPMAILQEDLNRLAEAEATTYRGPELSSYREWSSPVPGQQIPGQRIPGQRIPGQRVRGEPDTQPEAARPTHPAPSTPAGVWRSTAPAPNVF